jgi:parvulin-like peptidyl-prolyl isomerase
MTYRSTVLLSVAALMLCGGQALPPDTVVAQRGSVALTAGTMRQLIDLQDPAVRQQLANDPAAMDRAVRAEVLQMALLDQARAQKFDQKPDVALRADQARDNAIIAQYLASLAAPPPDYPSEAQVQAAYDANQQRFTVPRQVHLAQIFIPVPADATPAAKAAAENKARSVRLMLLKPKADFAAIAKAWSEDKATAAKGGDAGWLREDQMLPQIREAADSLKGNAVSEPIRMQDGWHIIKVLGTRPSQVAPLHDVHDQLVRLMRQQKMAQNERAYVEELMKKQPIQLNEIQLQQVLQK